MKRALPVLFAALASFWVTAAPADDPEVPETYVSVDEVKGMLDAKKPVAFIDVRPQDQYDELHIKGARSIPLKALPARLGEVSRRDYLVLY
jgi:3-mercaptopyruvate sulfurtransferase SseA